MRIPQSGYVMTLPTIVPMKLLATKLLLSSRGTHLVVMACREGNVEPSKIPWNMYYSLKPNLLLGNVLCYVVL